MTSIDKYSIDISATIRDAVKKMDVSTIDTIMVTKIGENSRCIYYR